MSVTRIITQWASVFVLCAAASVGCSKSGGTAKDTAGTDGNGTEKDSDSGAGTDTDVSAVDSEINAGTGEICGNGLDDDNDRALDCADSECADDPTCISEQSDEICDDGRDNDLDGRVDCADPDCADRLYCQEDCGDGEDNDGNSLTDCEDPACLGIDPACGEVCGDGLDNDGDGEFDCDDVDCADLNPCGIAGGDTDTVGTGDGMMCDYNGDLHVCACADALDNDGDGVADSNDLHCFGPFDDDEETFATGIPGDNEGSKGYTECPFDGNSGIGNDDICCNPADPTQNVVPNGCDNRACCEVDLNGNGTGETVGIFGGCRFAPVCGDDGTHGCPCANDDACDDGQFCVNDKNTGDGFCSTCTPCEPDPVCANPCSCGESCFAGFRRPDTECGTSSDGDADADTDGDSDSDADSDTDTTADTDTTVDSDTTSDTDSTPDTGGDTDTGTMSCPGGLDACRDNADCVAGYETCAGGCCYSKCADGVLPCEVTADCDAGYMCVTGCCIESGVIV